MDTRQVDFDVRRNSEAKEGLETLSALKLDAQRSQKKGLPFIMASVILWGMILAIQFLPGRVERLNLYTFICSCYLMPLAYLFSRFLGINIFAKTTNPICKLGFLCTMNQMLYIFIVMWAFTEKPEAMVMIYAMVFGAHLLPYGWVYDSKMYMVVSVLDTLGALLLTICFGNKVAILFIICMQLLLCIRLIREVREVEGRT